MEDQLAETWAIHNRINLYLLAAVPDDALGAALPKCRTVSDQFAHVHNVRLMWLKPAAPDLLEGQTTLETRVVAGKDRLASALGSSGLAVETLIRRAAASGGKVKGFKPHVTAFLGYQISHESRPRGQIGWTLKQSGHPIDQKTSFGLWEWGVR